VLPPGHKVPRVAKIKIRVGEPLTFESVRTLPSASRQRRAITDEVMNAIQALSGQDYVAMYASVRKEELAAQRNGAGPGR
jgi:1-acyl-sn-glycerol-3-phosphate acyltransferase